MSKITFYLILLACFVTMIGIITALIRDIKKLKEENKQLNCKLDSARINVEQMAEYIKSNDRIRKEEKKLQKKLRMRKPMKKYTVLSVILLLLITLGCRTTKVEESVTLPPKPQRQELKEPESIQDIANILNYYEHLVQEWETWGDSVETIISDKIK